jgi:SH3-like domain-containing protein
MWKKSRFAVLSILLGSVFLLPPPLLAAEKPPPPPPGPKLILRVKDKANIRSGPGTGYKKLWTAPKYTPLEMLCKYPDWYVVRDFEGFVGWVYAPLVEKGPALIVKVKQALARAGPGPDESPIWNVPKGYPMKVLERKGKWFHIEDAEGEKAWIYEDVVWGSTD